MADAVILSQMLVTAAEAASSAEGGASFIDATFFVALGFFTFIGILIWKKVPNMIAGALDGKAKEIEDQLDNARTLREDASKMLASYQRQQREAEEQVKQFVAQAEAESKLLADEAKQNIEDMVRRRTRLAEQKIAQAEAAAVGEIQQIVAEVAVSAARELIADNLKEADQKALIKDSIEGLDKRLH